MEMNEDIKDKQGNVVIEAGSFPVGEATETALTAEQEAIAAKTKDSYVKGAIKIGRASKLTEDELQAVFNVSYEEG